VGGLIATCQTCRYVNTPGYELPCMECDDNMWEPIDPYIPAAKQIGGDHYMLPIQPIEYIVENDIPYREANVIKYVTRHAKKNGRQDIEKAIHYLEMILEDYDDQRI